MNVSDLIRNLSKYEKETLQKSRVFPRMGFNPDHLRSDYRTIFIIGFIIGHLCDFGQKTTANAQKRTFQI